MSLLDAIELAAIAASVTIFALSIAALAMRARRRRSIGAQIMSLIFALGAGTAAYVGCSLLLGVRELRPLLSVAGHDG